MHPWRLRESEKIVEEENDIDSLVNEEIMPGLRSVIGLVIYNQCQKELRGKKSGGSS